MRWKADQYHASTCICVWQQRNSRSQAVLVLTVRARRRDAGTVTVNEVAEEFVKTTQFSLRKCANLRLIMHSISLATMHCQAC